MSNILITGASGYLASTTAKYLALHDHQLTLLSSKRVKLENRHQSIEYTWTSPKSLTRFLSGIDYILHYAGPNAATLHSTDKSSTEFRSLSCSLLLEAITSLSTSSPPTIIYFSSTQVYSHDLEYISECSPLTSSSLYGLSHKSAEDVLLSQSQIPILILRLSNIFGYSYLPLNPQPELFVHDLCFQALNRNQLTISSPVNKYIDFFPLSDFLRLLHTIVSCKSLPDILGSSIYNVSSSAPLSLYEMALLIQGVFQNVTGSYIPILSSFSETTNPRIISSSLFGHDLFVPALDIKSELCLTIQNIHDNA